MSIVTQTGPSGSAAAAPARRRGGPLEQRRNRALDQPQIGRALLDRHVAGVERHAFAAQVELGLGSRCFRAHAPERVERHERPFPAGRRRGFMRR